MYITKKQLLGCIKASTVQHDVFVEVDNDVTDSGRYVKVMKVKIVDSEKLYNMINDLQEYKPVPIQPFPANPQENILDRMQCMKCGISLTGVMSYSCPRSDCNTGLGSPFCLGAEQSKTIKPIHVDNPELTKAYHDGVWYQKENDQ